MVWLSSHKLYLSKMEEKFIKMHHLLDLLCPFWKTIVKHLKQQKFLTFYSFLQFTACLHILYLILPLTTTQQDGCNYCCYFLDENLKIKEVYFEDYLRARILCHSSFLCAISMFPKA